MHLFNRIAQIIPAMLPVSVLVFGLQQLMPGDPAMVLAAEERGDSPGFGKMIVDAVFNRVYPVVRGVALVTACLYFLLNLLADIPYVVINPGLCGS